MKEKLSPIAKIDRQIEDLTCRYISTSMSVETFKKRRQRLVDKRDRIVKTYKRKVDK